MMAEKSPPLVSVVIPARNAEATIAETLACLQAQTMPFWEAVVVDDLSTDGTAGIVGRFAGADPRIHLREGAGSGASAARNLGIDAVSGQWLLFLDADDWVDTEFLSKMTAALAGSQGAVAAFCAYQRLMPDGGLTSPTIQPALAEQPFELFARSCAATIHAVLVDRQLVVSVGGFDTCLLTCEDWDLWQRVARSGGRWVPVDEPLAFYRASATSLSRRGVDMLRDARTVISRGFGPDGRVPHPHPDHAEGAKRADYASADLALANFALWVFTADAVSEAKLEADINLLRPLTLTAGVAGQMASIMVDAMSVGLRVVPGGLAGLWSSYSDNLTGLIERVGFLHGDPDGARRLQYGLERLILDHDDLSEPRPLGLTLGIRTDIAHPEETFLAGAIDRVYAYLMHGTDILDVVQFGALGTISPRYWRMLAIDRLGEQFVVDAVRRIHGREFAAARLAHVIRDAARHPGNMLDPAGRCELSRRSRRKALLTLAGPAGDTGSHDAQLRLLIDEQRRQSAIPVQAGLDDRSSVPEPERGGDRTEFWETIFSVEDPWNYGSAYEEEKYRRQIALLPNRPFSRALELACAEGHFTANLAAKVETLLATDISAKALERAQARNSGIPHITYRQLDLAVDAIPDGQDLIVCSEVLYYLADESELRRVLRRIVDALAPGGHLLTAHAFVLKDDLRRTGFDWDNPFGVATISRALAELPDLARERGLETELYRIECYRRLAPGEPRPDPVDEHADIVAEIEPEVARHIVWGGAAVRRADVRGERRDRIPVLMYHGVVDDGPPALARWRVSGRAFAAQMRWLRANGYHAIGSAELGWFIRNGHAFVGRPVMITFDDGQQSFADNAWAALRANDLFAEMFPVTDFIGRTADWDSAAGAPVQLMDAGTLARLSADGVRFGSHLETHRAVDGLSTRVLAEELAGSRETLNGCLGYRPDSFAAPYSIADQRLAFLARECGYTIGFGNLEGPARLTDDPMNLPRIEIRGDWSMVEFTRAMEAAG